MFFPGNLYARIYTEDYMMNLCKFCNCLSKWVTFTLE